MVILYNFSQNPRTRCFYFIVSLLLMTDAE